MSDTYNLYNGTPPHQSHSDTSFEAAESIQRKIGPLHRKILEYLKSHPATDEQMQLALDMGANTQRPRRRELQLMNRVEDSGIRSLTYSGRRAVIWRLTELPHHADRPATRRVVASKE